MLAYIRSEITYLKQYVDLWNIAWNGKDMKQTKYDLHKI